MRRLSALLIGACLSAGVAAQGARLVDPTRPPLAGPAANAGEAAPAPRPRLQSVLISPSRRIAVISGTTVSRGDRFGDAVVVEIGESWVKLQAGNRGETLHLLPEAAKRYRRVPAQAQSDRGNSQ